MAELLPPGWKPRLHSRQDAGRYTSVSRRRHRPVFPHFSIAGRGLKNDDIRSIIVSVIA
jgi:hypothetical protein